MNKPLVFISYNKKDRKWVDELHKGFMPLVREGLFELWDDSQIAIGSKWQKEIKRAIERADVAILIVTSDFLASDFIHHEELSLILEKAETKNLKIMWIPVGYCLYEDSDIHSYQAAYKPDKPLSTLRKPGREKAWRDIAENLKKVIASLKEEAGADLVSLSNIPTLRKSRVPQSNIKPDVEEAVKDFYGDECVVTGEECGLRRLNNGQVDEFGNLIPLSEKVEIEKMHSTILFPKAKLLYFQGMTPCAFGCARISYAAQAYYKKNDPNEEMKSAGLALYYLRRCLGIYKLHLIKIYRLLSHILDKEINPFLERKPLVGPLAIFHFLEELCSWLNEQGMPKVAYDSLSLIRDRLGGLAGLDGAERSRLLRQFAMSSVLTNKDSHEVEKILDDAYNQASSPQNHHGVINIKTILCLRDRFYTKAYELVEQQLDELNLRSPSDFEHPELTGVSLPTLLGPLTHRTLTLLHDGNHEAMRQNMDILWRIEDKTYHHAVMVWHPTSQYAAAKKSAGDFNFLGYRTMPTIPPDVAKKIQRAIDLLWPLIL